MKKTSINQTVKCTGRMFPILLIGKEVLRFYSFLSLLHRPLSIVLYQLFMKNIEVKKDETSNWITFEQKNASENCGRTPDKGALCRRDYSVKYGVSLCSSGYLVFRGIFYNLASFFLISSRLWSYISQYEYCHSDKIEDYGICIHHCICLVK